MNLRDWKVWAALVATFAALALMGILIGVATNAEAHKGCHTHACKVRVWNKQHPFQTALVSWYENGGSTASGWHAYNGFAAREWLSFGSRVRFCAVRCATGTMDDHGPYTGGNFPSQGGRLFDIGPQLRDALGCGGLCWVKWRRPYPR